MRLLRRQPFKTAYLVFELFATITIRIPYWALSSIPKSLRPRASWPIKRCILVNLTRHLIYVTSLTGPIPGRSLPNHHAITPSLEAEGVWVSPAPSSLITGPLLIWSAAAKVSQIRIPGYWLNKRGTTIRAGAPPMPTEKVVYALHGGAYCRLSAHPSDPTAAIARGLVKHVDSVQRVFSVEYRLSAGPPNVKENTNPFPAALLDALAGYNYLVNEVGFAPEDIIIEGDSAGGNLALALTRYLVEHHRDNSSIPAPPGALILLSPWSDLGDSHHVLNSTYYTNQRSDYLFPTAPSSSQKGFGYPVRAFLGPHGAGMADVNPYVSPASLHLALEGVSFKGFPRTFIVAGEAEILHDGIVTLKDRMVKDLGERKDGVKWYDCKDGIHDYIAIGYFEPERTQTLKAIAEWVADA